MVDRLMDASEGCMDEGCVPSSLGDLWDAASDPALFRVEGPLLNVLVLLGGEWLYSGMLGSASSLSLAV